MTVALGLVCSDGVLVASDSMGSDGAIAAISQKVRAFGRTPAIWTASGSVYVMEEVTAELDRLDQSGSGSAPMKSFTDPDLPSIRSKLTTSVIKGMRSAYGTALNVAPPEPGKPTAVPFPTSFLILGYANDTPWFLEIDPSGQLNWHTDSTSGFYSTGSGGPFAAVATGLMGHYLERRVPLEIGKMIAYRAIETTVAVSSQGVGLPVQIAVCDNEGTSILTEEELAEVSTGVERWKALERESILTTPEEAQEEAVGDLPEMALE